MAGAPLGETTRTTIAVLGAAGRMGGAIIRVLAGAADVALTAAVEHAQSPKLGLDAGTLAGIGEAGVPISAGPPAAGVASIWIDFSSPSATASTAAAAVAAGAALVVGTTGVTADGKQALAEAARSIPVVFAPNTSVGVTALLRLVADAARLLGPDYDLEIVETHHRMKRDAPSGTALRLAEALAEATGRDLAKDARYARQGDVGPRTQAEIGIQTLRGGDVIGDHTVFFFGQGERIEITHRASSRDTFARGAVRAAQWVRGRAPGLYDMRDVLGIR
ncbi:MAG TPA: 4-hydroxy-tetrahydrodipicolinate reductase [Polyangia bacterium]|jgi:4-hydroxy-tetrahydrodipicolinate reductase